MNTITCTNNEGKSKKTLDVFAEAFGLPRDEEVEFISWNGNKKVFTGLKLMQEMGELLKEERAMQQSGCYMQ